MLVIMLMIKKIMGLEGTYSKIPPTDKVYLNDSYLYELENTKLIATENWPKGSIEEFNILKIEILKSPKPNLFGLGRGILILG